MPTRVSTTLSEARAVVVETHLTRDTRPRRWPDSTPPQTVTRRALAAVAADIEVPVRPIRYMRLKRLIDVIGSLIGILLAMPLFLLISLVVKATSKGPAFFVQERCGLRGTVFRFYKFRTMVVDAEERKAELQHLNEVRGPAFKIRRDPRVTRVGHFLRKSSLDELPQLLNVLRGDMSLVGPRPPTVDEVENYSPRQAQRLSVTPGMTGLWQVSGRNDIEDFEQWLELDLEYARTQSLRLDLSILAKTVVVVVCARGAQ